jgi:hypothetical protein
MRCSTAALGLSLLVLACEDRKAPPPEPSGPAPAVSELSELAIDAGALGEPADPPAPPGDLKADLDRFVNVDTCVAERAKLDPLVGDALGAIGYETFLRDACRLLEAAKDKNRAVCDRIDSSALRARCRSWVAMVAQTPDACPMQIEGVVTRGRNPSCVAIAARDPRLCAGEGRSAERGTCEALVLRDPAKCDALLPNQRPACRREVARWASVLSASLEGLDPLPRPRAQLVVRGASGTPDPPSPEVDLSADFARGVVVVTGRESAVAGQRMRVEFGSVAESEAARIAASPQKRTRVGLAVVFEAKNEGAAARAEPAVPSARREKLELELPGEAPLVSPPSTCDCKLTTARATDRRGGEVAITLEGTLSGGGRSYAVKLDVVTFARDIVSEADGATRVLPPVHPLLTASPARGRLDAGRR